MAPAGSPRAGTTAWTSMRTITRPTSTSPDCGNRTRSPMALTVAHGRGPVDDNLDAQVAIGR